MMFERIVASLYDGLHHLLLHPPLLISRDDDGRGAGSSTSPSVLDDLDVGNNKNHNQPYFLRYLPVLVLLTLFWPILLTLIAASVSASAWLFWLCIGAAFSVVQLLYVLWNFAMIIWDVCALTMLKTFAIIRSFVRQYVYLLGMRNAKGQEESRRRKRRDWRTEVDGASNFEEYSKIELLEPEGRCKGRDGDVAEDSKEVASSKRRRAMDVRSRKNDNAFITRSSSIGLRRRRKDEDHPTAASTEAASGGGNDIRKFHSFRDLNEASSGGSSVCPSRRNIVFQSNPSPPTSSMPPLQLRRVSSSALPLRNSFDSTQDDNNDDDDNHDSKNEEYGTDEGCLRWQRAVRDDLGMMTGSILLTTLNRLKEARVQAMSSTMISNYDDNYHPNNCNSNNDYEDYSSSSSLKTLLSGIVKRNHLSVDDFLMEDARSVAERGQHTQTRATRDTIDRYGEEVERCIEFIASGTVHLGGGRRSDTSFSTMEGGSSPPSQAAAYPNCKTNSHSANEQQSMHKQQQDELSRRYVLFKKMKQNLGHTALMLSGGGAQAMYHLGTIKALVESNLYEHIHVISGTSGGSIVAAMCAIKTPEELLRDICVNTVSTDYMRTGKMKKQGVSWFPSIYKMGETWMTSGVLMDSKEFFRCCEFYYSNITFEEAYEMTGKHVCITVSASRAYAGSGVQRLLLNHISTPHVTLSSAVAASCALPGAMSPKKLMMKNGRGGEQVPFEVDGVEWIDGSVQADLPFKRISTLFNISNFVVAQTNFHVVPFLNKSHHPNVTTLYWKLFQMCMWDVQSRVIKLSQLGLFPTIFGQDLTKLVTQKYYGKLTLVPRFTTLQMFGLKILSNPTVKDMDNYLQNGQVAAWPYLRVLKEMLRLERSIDAGLTTLDLRLKSVASVLSSTTLPNNDDVDSVCSANHRGRLPGLGREAELLKVENCNLRNENKYLREQVARLQQRSKMSMSAHADVDSTLVGQLISISDCENEVTY